MNLFKSVRISTKAIKTISAVSVLAVLAGCDESGDSIGPKPPITVNGQVMKGALVGAPVNIFRADSGGNIPISPNEDGVEEGLYTDENGEFSIELNGDDYRDKTLVVKVGSTICTSETCEGSNGATVNQDEEYFLGSYRCDDPNGCIDPTDLSIVAFGELVPLDFELISVVPIIENSSSIDSQDIGISVLTTLAVEEILLLGGYSELFARAGNQKIAEVFQLDGIDLVSQPMVDVSNLSSAVESDETWLLSVVNAGIIASSTKPSNVVSQTTMGEALTALKQEYENRSNQLVYNNSTENDLDLSAFYEVAQSITNRPSVTGFVSDSAKESLTEKETFINSQTPDSRTDETLDVSPDQDTLDALADAQSYMFDTTDWYTDTVAPGTTAHTKFDFMMDSMRAGQRESIGYMETLGNDFTLVLAAALNSIIDSNLSSAVTLNSTDKDGNAVTATLTPVSGGYTVEGDYLNSSFDIKFSVSETTNDEGVLPDNPPEGEEDDRVFRFDIDPDASDVEFAASNEGLTLNFNTDSNAGNDSAVSLQIDSEFDGTEATTVRSSYRWEDITLAQTDIGSYDQTLGRITIDGQLIFSMEHVADTIQREDLDGDGETDTFNVPRVDGREFVFLQFGINDPLSPVASKFRLTVANTDTQTGDTWPVSYLFRVLNHVSSGTEGYSAEGFGSFDQDYLTGTGSSDWGETSCDFLPVSYAISFSHNTSDDETFNDIDVVLDTSILDEDDNVENLAYALSVVRESTQLQAQIKSLKDQDELCSVSFQASDGSTSTVDFYDSTTISESGSYNDRVVLYVGLGDVTNNHSLTFSDDNATGLITYDDCENFGSYSATGGDPLGRLYSCDTPETGGDDEQCLIDGAYTDFSSGLVSGEKIERENGEITVTNDNYSSCSDYDSGTGENEWEVRYIDGTIQVLPFDLTGFGVQ